ncbi:uncharacterized protein LOC132744286 [Ruditapes philippinarum]|uniref:uncharacterized protein LOC132744286 n=1 Tax=Ruditapes philippinarum TaxID=129788 RepID=UPI00295BEB1C|nr:uncharacterized protein LOC132744286 [Ruditapes philippinarum]
MENYMRRLVLFSVFVTIVAVVYGQQCNVVPKCTCKYGDEDVDVEEQDTGNEALAGAVGALGSVVVSGGGFGVWYMLRGRNSGSASFERSDSSMSEESVDRGKEGKGPPQEFNKKKSEANGGYVKTPNIYSAGRNDKLSHNVGMPGTIADF